MLTWWHMAQTQQSTCDQQSVISQTGLKWRRSGWGYRVGGACDILDKVIRKWCHLSPQPMAAHPAFHDHCMISSVTHSLIFTHCCAHPVITCTHWTWWRCIITRTAENSIHIIITCLTEAFFSLMSVSWSLFLRKCCVALWNMLFVPTAIRYFYSLLFFRQFTMYKTPHVLFWSSQKHKTLPHAVSLWVSSCLAMSLFCLSFLLLLLLLITNSLKKQVLCACVSKAWHWHWMTCSFITMNIHCQADLNTHWSTKCGLM